MENWFARLDSIDDRMPDMIVARFPVRSPEELETLIQKTVSYHRNPPTGDWYNRVFMLTDDGFENYSEELMEQWIPDGFRLTSRHISDYPLVDNIYLPEHLRIATRAKTSLEATKDIIDILNQGVFLWEYFGHGAPNVTVRAHVFGGDQNIPRCANSPIGSCCPSSRHSPVKRQLLIILVINGISPLVRIC